MIKYIFNILQEGNV